MDKKIYYMSINDANIHFCPKDLTYKTFLQNLDKAIETGTDFMLIECDDGATIIGLKNVWQMKIGFK